MREAELEVVGEVIPSRLRDLRDRLGGNLSVAPPRFLRHKLTESTSMVHSPIDINNVAASSERFPLASSVKYIDCTVSEGQAIFVPSFFWHEVRSSPNRHPSQQDTDSIGNYREGDQKKVCRWEQMPHNMAINFWFSPLFDKKFPCASCRKQLSGNYRDVLLSHMSRNHLIDGFIIDWLN